MSDSVYSFRSGPNYRGATPDETFRAALDQPMSMASTFFDQAKGGILESFGLGTALRDFTIPEGKPVEDEKDDDGFGIRDAMELLSPHPVLRTYDIAKDFAQSFVNDPNSPALSEDAYKSSAWFREDIPWDQAMTEQRAEALSESFDAKKVREFYASKRPFSSFIGNLGGQAFDPINYVPVAGPLVKAGMVAKLGKVSGASVAAALDASANTAIFGVATAGARSRYGDDVSWQTTVSQIATAALIGSAFGAIGGALGRRGDAVSRNAIEERLSTLKTTQEARIALNEGIDALVRGEDVRLSPNATEPARRIAGEVQVALDAPTIQSVEMKPPATLAQFEKFSTGEPVSFRFARNPDMKASDFPADAFGRDIEPAGRYMVDVTDGAVPDKWESGEISFKKPLVVESRDGQWKAELKEHYGATGKKLSQKIVNDGYDGIVTIDGKYGPSEIVDLSGFKPRKTKAKALSTSAEGIKRETPSIAGRQEATTATQRAVDTTPARAEPLPEGLKEAEKAIAKPDDYKALANQYRVDPETGRFDEEVDIAQLRTEGRLTDEDVAVLAEAQNTYDDGAAYGEALKSVANCLV